MSQARWRPAFIRNRGQHPEAVRFFTDPGGDRLLLTADSAVWVYALPNQRVWAITLRLPGATTIQLVERAPGVVSLFRGPDATRWRTGQERWSALRFVDAWPGIDLTFRVGDGLAWTFEIAPGVEPDVLSLVWEGASLLRLDEDGDLLMREGDLQLFQPRPVALQAGKSVPVSYALQGPDRVGFALGPYDAMLPIQITIARRGIE